MIGSQFVRLSHCLPVQTGISKVSQKPFSEKPFKDHNKNFHLLRNAQDLAIINGRHIAFETFSAVYLCKQVFRVSRRETKTKGLNNRGNIFFLLRKIKPHHECAKPSLSKTIAPLLGQGTALRTLHI